jgi:hypothetical protein
MTWFGRVPRVAFLAFVAVAGSTARADSDADAALRQEIGELKHTLQQLGARVESLEQRLAGRPEPTPQQTIEGTTAGAARNDSSPPSAPGGTPQERWKRITRGMSVEQVEALLGHPQRTVDMSPKTIWYYSYEGVGNGSVVFIKDGGVIDWQSPPFGTWW